MRHTVASLNVYNDETDKGLNESFIETPFDVKQKKIKRDKLCFVTLWTLSNVVTFMMGYYVKKHWFTDEYLVDGSM